MKRRLEYIFYRVIYGTKKRLGLDYDKSYAKAMYVAWTGKHLHLHNPKRFNEKIQWIKLYYRRNIMTQLADKYAVREWIKDTIGEEYLIPLLGVYDSFDEIDFDKLPNEFVLKCNHDCDSVIIVKDKSTLDLNAARDKINYCLSRNYYYFAQEWVYKNIPPKIVIEKLLENDSNNRLNDYKFFCFNGEPRLMYVNLRDMNTKNGSFPINYYDMEFSLLPISQTQHPNVNASVNKPIHFEKMKDLAKTLSQDFPFVRVDFYEVNNRVYFGEMTFYPTGGFNELHPDEWNDTLGSWITLPPKKIIEN